MKGWHAPKFTKEDVRKKLTDQDIKDILELLKGSIAIEGLNDYVDAMNKTERRDRNGRQIQNKIMGRYGAKIHGSN